jgi:hypothetical protein
LVRHAGRSGDHREIDPEPKQQFPQDQTGLDSFAQAGVVGDQQVYPRQPECFAEGEKLVRV